MSETAVATVRNSEIGHMYLPVDAIDISGNNPRTRFDKDKLAELGESILTHGVLVPIVVRPKGTRFELVAGERRLRATRDVGIGEIPAIIRELSDKEALEVQVIENLQREDLHPLEEAEGYARLMRDHGYDADSLAAKIGKSRSYVYGRMKLADLTKKAKDALWKDEISHSVALLIARLPSDGQEQALEEITARNRFDDPMSFREVRAYLEDEFFLGLADAAWKLDDAQLVPTAGPCTTCPHRSGNQKELFGNVAKNADVCTKPNCYHDKAEAFWQRVKTQAEAGGARILPESEQEATFSEYGSVKPGGKYVRADETCYEDSKSRNYNQIVGKSTKAFLARDPRGKIVRLYERAELKQALKAAGVREERVAPAVEHSWQREARIRAEKAKLDRAVEAAIVAELRPKLAKLPLEAKTLRIFTRAIAVDRYYHLERWLKDQGVKASGQSRDKTIATVVDKMKTAGEMLALIAEALLAFNPSEMRSSIEKSMAVELCALVKVDAPAIEKRVRAEAAAKKRASTVKGVKATKKAKAR